MKIRKYIKIIGIVVSAIFITHEGFGDSSGGSGTSTGTAAAAPARRVMRTEFRLPVLSVNDAGGKFQRIDFEFSRKANERPLVVSIGDVESGGSGDELRASVWSAAMVAALMRSDLMAGTRITLDFSGRVDGPSAGGVFCLAILSALDGREFPEDFAMTGSILPDGSLGLVGGVEQKIDAAAKAGIKRVCIPALGRVEESEGNNLTDLVRHAERCGVELILAETVEEAYAAAHRLTPPKKETISEREILASSRIQEYFWYDNVFDNYNRATAISRCHNSKDLVYSHYFDEKFRSRKLFKAGYFQKAAECAFENLLFWRAWDARFAVRNKFFREHPEGDKPLTDPDAKATDKDRELLSAYRKYLEDYRRYFIFTPMMPEPEENDSDAQKTSDGLGFSRTAPWVTEITAQLDPTFAKLDAIAWADFWDICQEEDVSKLKTKWDVFYQMNLAAYQDLWIRIRVGRDNESTYFLEDAARMPQIRGNANLMRAGTFYHAAQTAVNRSLVVGYKDSFSNNRQLLRFLRGTDISNSFFEEARNAEKIVDPAYDALARIILDCRVLALGAALQIYYGPDVGDISRSSYWVNGYGNAYFLNARIRTAREQALKNIKKCRDKNIPCPAALSAFIEAETSNGDRERDQLFDVLANYWTAGNIAQALNLCFDAQPTTEQAAADGNADALFLLGHHEVVFGDIDKAQKLLKKSAELGDARAQFWLSVIVEQKNNDKAAARAWLEKSAAQHYVPALERLAWKYWKGEEGFVAQDRKKAFSLFKTAAYLGSADAQERLAWCYLNEAEIVPRDEVRGYKWQALAAERDDLSAQHRMAGDYRNSAKEYEDDKFEMFRWFSRAAEQGGAYDAALLGDCYWYGNGVEKDMKKAAEWFKKSAERGDDYGQYNWGYCLYTGSGVKKDEREGLEWLRKAAENGSENAKSYLKEIGK